jgi:TonB family protein
MNKPRKGSESLHLPTGLTPSGRGRLYKTGLFSLLLHLTLIFFLVLNLMPGFSRSGRAVYRVTLKPFSPPGDGRPAGRSGPGLPGTPEAPKTSESPLKAEKSAPDEGSKGREAVETKKRDRLKAERVEKGEVSRSVKKEKKVEQPRENKLVEGFKKSDRKEMKVERERSSGKSLQEAIEDIHKRVALDEIQKKVARRGGGDKAPAEVLSKAERSTGSQVTGPSSSSRSPALIGSGIGTGTGSGSGTGTGTGTGTGSGGSPWGSSLLESKLNDYYSLIWAKIKEGWTLPENLPKEKTELEAIIVVIIEKGGKVQKSWFEKKSGSALYDQMAMRAIKKAEPFPPIPKELSDDSLEIGFRFYPE